MAKKARKAYPLPQIMPEGFKCVTVYIPDTLECYGAFWNSYEYLATAGAWETDEAHTAIDVAALWKTAVAMATALWPDEQGCGMSYELRQNEDNPCLLEQSFDGGETWSLAFDHRLCALQITTPPPYPDSDTAQADAATALVRNMFEEIVNLADEMCGGTRQEYINAATNYLRGYDGTFANPAALGGVFDEVCAMSEPERELAKQDCTYAGKKDDAEECYDPVGGALGIACWQETIGNWLNETVDALGNWLNIMAASLSPQGIQNLSAGGAGGGAGFSGDCLWTHIWNDDNGWSGWSGETNQGGAAPSGTLSGIGWHPVEQHYDDGDLNRLNIGIDVPSGAYTITNIDYIIDMPDVLRQCYIVTNDGSGDFVRENTINDPGTDVHVGCIIGESALEHVRVGADNATTGDDCVIKQISMQGTGIDPFS
jgi:hypothetical protein